MKLTNHQITRIHDELEAQPIPEEEPVIERLSEVFGDHTFYLSESGLFVWDLTDPADGATGQLVAVQVASWTDETRSAMQAHEPIQTDVVVDIPAAPAPAANTNAKDQD